MKVAGLDRKLKMKLRNKIEPEFARHGYLVVTLGITPIPASCLGEFKIYKSVRRVATLTTFSDGSLPGLTAVKFIDEKHCTQEPIFRFYNLQFQWGMLINGVHRVIQPEMYYYGDLRNFVNSLVVMELMEE